MKIAILLWLIFSIFQTYGANIGKDSKFLEAKLLQPPCHMSARNIKKYMTTQVYNYVFPDKPKKVEITCQNSMSKLRQALENFGQFEMEHIPNLPHLSEKDFLTFIKEWKNQKNLLNELTESTTMISKSSGFIISTSTTISLGFDSIFLLNSFAIILL